MVRPLCSDRGSLSIAKSRRMKAGVHITLKPGVLDPQGKAIANALKSLAFSGVNQVRQGKYIEIDLDESDPRRARETIEAMCSKLLANLIIEDYKIELFE